MECCVSETPRGLNVGEALVAENSLDLKLLFRADVAGSLPERPGYMRLRITFSHVAGLQSNWIFCNALNTLRLPEATTQAPALPLRVRLSRGGKKIRCWPGVFL